MTQDELQKYMEAQKPRLFDMFALGPFMLWYAMQSGKRGGMSKWPRRVLFVSGVMTIVYNWKNYRNASTILEEKATEVQASLSQLSRNNFLTKG